MIQTTLPGPHKTLTQICPLLSLKLTLSSFKTNVRYVFESFPEFISVQCSNRRTKYISFKEALIVSTKPLLIPFEIAINDQENIF